MCSIFSHSPSRSIATKGVKSYNGVPYLRTHAKSPQSKTFSRAVPKRNKLPHIHMTPAISTPVTILSSSNDLNMTVACVTWNLQELTPSRSDCEFLLNFRSKDLVVLGVQECEALKPRRKEGSRSIALKHRLKATLGTSLLHSGAV